jgi:thiosulfate/3-mercaptopyruvate sulfurtransferase
MSLVDTEWLEKNLDKTKIIDCSWHMSQTNRNGFEEYKKQHIKNAIFFDLDKNSKKNTDLPHMLTDIKSWENIVSDMGIKNNDEIVIYDNSDVISSCRCWYNFIYFGHDPKLVHVLDGGLKKWNTEKKQTNEEITQIKKTQYKAIEFKNLVKSKNQIDENINLAKFKISSTSNSGCSKAAKCPPLFIVVHCLILNKRSTYDRGGHSDISAGNNAIAVGTSIL